MRPAAVDDDVAVELKLGTAAGVAARHRDGGRVYHPADTVRALQRYEREPAGHLLLVLGVYVGRVANVDGHGHGGVVERQGVGLRLAQGRPSRLRLHEAGLKVGRQLHEIERHVGRVAHLAPVGNKPAEQRGILLGAAHVGTSLVPQHTFDGHGDYGAHHGIVKHGGERRPRGRDGLAGQLAEIGKDLILPAACQRHGVATARHGHVAGVAADAALALIIGHAHRHDGSAALDHAARHDV